MVEIGSSIIRDSVVDIGVPVVRDSVVEIGGSVVRDSVVKIASSVVVGNGNWVIGFEVSVADEIGASDVKALAAVVENRLDVA